MASYLVEVADHVEPERALSALNRLAEMMAMGPMLVTPLPAGFPEAAMPNLAFRVRYEIDKMMGTVPEAASAEAP